MYKHIKRFNLTLIFVVLLSISLAQIPSVFSAEPLSPEKAFSFMEDIIQLDMANYNATLVVHNVDYPDDIDSIDLKREDLTYTLEYGESKLNVAFIFKNGILTWCKLYVLNGVPLYTQTSENILESVKSFVTRYKTKRDTLYLQQIRDTLDSIDELENIETTSDDIKFTVLIEDSDTRLDWSYMSDGIDFLGKSVSIRFNEGTFVMFKDNWDIYDVGSTQINISKEEAAKVAKEQAENYTLEVYKGEEGLVEIEFNISDEPAKVELWTITRDSTLLYPFWDVVVDFDGVYHRYYGIQVGIWADTGEVAYCHALSGLGGSQAEDSTQAESTSQSGINSPPPLRLDIVAVVSTIIIITALAMLVIKKKHK